MRAESRPGLPSPHPPVVPPTSLVLTVTPNTGLDRVLFLDRLKPGRNAARVAWAMGGKGCDVSLILRGLEVPTLATGFTAGDMGHRVEATGTHTTLCAESLRVSQEHVEVLAALVEREAPRAGLAVLAGSLPEGV